MYLFTFYTSEQMKRKCMNKPTIKGTAGKYFNAYYSPL